MVSISDSLFDECCGILDRVGSLEEEKTEELEKLLATKLRANASDLEQIVLDTLWRHRNLNQVPANNVALNSGKDQFYGRPLTSNASNSRRGSPAPWQNGSPARPPPPTISSLSPSNGNSLSFNPATAPFISSLLFPSPFSSPKSSPRLALKQPPYHSPSMNSAMTSWDVVDTESSGRHQSLQDVDPFLDGDEPFHYYDSDWIPEANTSGSSPAGIAMNYSWAIGVSPETRAQDNMTPHDMLRSILGEDRSDEEIERALIDSGYDLGAAMAMLMEPPAQESPPNNSGGVVIGRSTGNFGAEHGLGQSPRPLSSLSGSSQGVVCRYFLQMGSCLRADCKFSHDLRSTICKYWLTGSCLAGEMCMFSHDPASSLNRLSISPAQTPSSMVMQHIPSDDASSFSALLGSGRDTGYGVSGLAAMSPLPRGHGAAGNISRGLTGRQQGNDISISAVPRVDDTEAFPSLSQVVGGKGNKRGRVGKQGHFNDHGKEKSSIASSAGYSRQSSLADIVRMSPSPLQVGESSKVSKVWNTRSSSPLVPTQIMRRNIGDINIPPPQQIPWVDTGASMNKLYMRHRAAAIKHGALRNKYLQGAAGAWGRNDAKTAKSLSLKGQNENDLMRKAHRLAASAIYEERNLKQKENRIEGVELFCDLHGLHADEAIEYLESILLEHQHSSTPLYAIIGTGHHSKNGKDNIGRPLRGFLDNWRYNFREFAMQGERSSQDGILGIIPNSFDKSLLSVMQTSSGYLNGHLDKRPQSSGRRASTSPKIKTMPARLAPTESAGLRQS